MNVNVNVNSLDLDGARALGGAGACGQTLPSTVVGWTLMCKVMHRVMCIMSTCIYQKRCKKANGPKRRFMCFCLSRQQSSATSVLSEPPA